MNDFIPLFDGQITPLDNSKHSHNLVCAYVELALSDYKLLQVMTSGEILVLHMEFLEVYKANVQANPADMVRMPFKAKHANFYITFLVKNKKDGSIQTLQTLV